MNGRNRSAQMQIISTRLAAKYFLPSTACYSLLPHLRRNPVLPGSSLPFINGAYAIPAHTETRQQAHINTVKEGAISPQLFGRQRHGSIRQGTA